jgi:hypothetical protein
MTSPTPTRSLRSVSTSMPAPSGTAPTSVRMTNRVVTALEELPSDQAASVAQAIDRIGHTEGTPFRPRGEADQSYMVMVPNHDAAPVVLYRHEDGGYLVTGLVKRVDYRTYTRSESPTAFLDSPAGQAALIAGGALVIAYLLSRGKNAGSGGPSGAAA